MFRETVSGSDGSFIASGLTPGTYEVAAELAGLQEVQPQGSDPRGREDRVDRDRAWRSAAIEQTVNVIGGIAARRRHVEGDRRQHHQRDARPAAERQRQLHRLHRPAARHRPVDQHRVVRQRLGQRQRPGSAQQQLHGRRRQQQRRRHRAARGDAGADADRGDPGIPGHHQPVRRRVRPHRPARSSTRSPRPAPTHARQRVRLLPGRQPDGEGLLRAKNEQTCARRTRSYQRWGGTFGGPIVKDKMHYLRQPRAVLDRPAEHHH